MGRGQRLHGRLVRRRWCAGRIDVHGGARASHENVATRSRGHAGVHAHAGGTRRDCKCDRTTVAGSVRDGSRFVEPDDDGWLARPAPRQTRYPCQRDRDHGAVDVEGREIRVRSGNDVEPRLPTVPDGESAADLYRGIAREHDRDGRRDRRRRDFQPVAEARAEENDRAREDRRETCGQELAGRRNRQPRDGARDRRQSRRAQSVPRRVRAVLRNAGVQQVPRVGRVRRRGRHDHRGLGGERSRQDRWRVDRCADRRSCDHRHAKTNAAQRIREDAAGGIHTHIIAPLAGSNAAEAMRTFKAFTPDQFSF